MITSSRTVPSTVSRAPRPKLDGPYVYSVRTSVASPELRKFRQAPARHAMVDQSLALRHGRLLRPLL